MKYSWMKFLTKRFLLYCSPLRIINDLIASTALSDITVRTDADAHDARTVSALALVYERSESRQQPDADGE